MLPNDKCDRFDNRAAPLNLGALGTAVPHHSRLRPNGRRGPIPGMSETPVEPLVVLVRDLIFSSKITGTAKVLNVATRLVRDPGQLSGVGGNRMIVDLNLDGAIAAAAAWKVATGGEVIGFVSHVDAATIDVARHAGLDKIMPRSRFVEQLPALLGGSHPARESVD